MYSPARRVVPTQGDDGQVGGGHQPAASSSDDPERHRAPQQRRGAVALLAPLGPQGLDRHQHLLEADRLAPLHRPPGVVEAQLHARVDVRGRAHALADGERRLVDQLADDAPRHAARAPLAPATRPPGPVEREQLLGLLAARAAELHQPPAGQGVVAGERRGRAAWRASAGPTSEARARSPPRAPPPSAGGSPAPARGPWAGGAPRRSCTSRGRVLRPRRPASTIRCWSGLGRQRGSPKDSSVNDLATSSPTSMPTRSISSNGPMRKPPPSRQMRSICSTVATRSVSSRSASAPKGRPQRLTRKPGPSAARITRLPIASPASARLAAPRSPVWSAAITSTSRIFGGRVEEVHAHHELGSRRGAGERGHRDRRGVGGQHAPRARSPTAARTARA